MSRTCPCGGMLQPSSAKKSGAVLHFEICNSCGRCGMWRLYKLENGKEQLIAEEEAHLLWQKFKQA